jgi:hypothetical protein
MNTPFYSNRDILPHPNLPVRNDSWLDGSPKPYFTLWKNNENPSSIKYILVGMEKQSQASFICYILLILNNSTGSGNQNLIKILSLLLLLSFAASEVSVHLNKAPFRME